MGTGRIRAYTGPEPLSVLQFTYPTSSSLSTSSLTKTKVSALPILPFLGNAQYYSLLYDVTHEIYTAGRRNLGEIGIKT